MTAKDRAAALPHIIQEDENWVFAPVLMVEAAIRTAELEATKRVRERDVGTARLFAASAPNIYWAECANRIAAALENLPLEEA